MYTHIPKSSYRKQYEKTLSTSALVLRPYLFESIKKLVEKRLSSSEIPKKPTRKFWGESVVQDAVLSEANFYVNAKQWLMILEDQRRGIISTYHMIGNPSHLVLIRDASGQPEHVKSKKDLAPIKWQEWARMGLAYFQIAEQILIDKDQINLVNKLAIQFLNALSSGQATHPQAYAYYMINEQLPRLMGTLNQAFSDTKKTRKLLQSLKDFGNMEEKPCALVTITKVGENKSCIVEIDIPITTLTEAQQKEYQNISKEGGGKPRWYQLLTPEKKQMVDRYASKIANGECVIPTQMLTEIPGPRNAGEKRGYSVNGDSLTLESSLIHCGNLAQDIKGNFDENVRLAKENILAMQATQSGNTMCIQSHISPNIVTLALAVGATFGWLLAPVAAVAGVASLVGATVCAVASPVLSLFSPSLAKKSISWRDSAWKLAKTSAGLTAASLLSLPFAIAQGFSAVSQNVFGGDTLLDWAVKKIPGNVAAMNERRLHLVLRQAVKELNQVEPEPKYIYSNEPLDWSRMFWFLKEEQTVEKHILAEAIKLPKTRENEKYREMDRLINRLESLHELKWDSFVFGKQKTAERKAIITQILSLYNELCSPEQKISSASFCKSGKDRQGFLEMIVLLYVADKEVGQSLGDRLNSEVGQKLSSSGHTQQRAGLQAGGIGANTLKDDGHVLVNGLTAGVQNELTGPTGSANKKIKLKDPNQEMRKLVERSPSICLLEKDPSSVAEIESSYFNQIKDALEEHPKALVKGSSFWPSYEYPEGIRRIIEICDSGSDKKWVAINKVVNDKCGKSERGIYQKLREQFDSLNTTTNPSNDIIASVREYCKEEGARLQKQEHVEARIYSKM